jgi:hypothetical protein
MQSLTTKELALINEIVQHDEFGEPGNLDNCPWSWAVRGTKSTGAVLGSLIAVATAFLCA